MISNNNSKYDQLPLDIEPSQYGKKRSKELGNHFIYSKLSGSLKWNDARLQVLKPDYFKDKVILDIGCNEGILAIPIAIRYQPKLVHAIDIDPLMVSKARSNLEFFVEKNDGYRYPKQIIEDISTLPLYLQQKISKRHGETVFQIDPKYQLSPPQSTPCIPFPKNISISPENILAPLQLRKYDCILCMNVTKWIHLAYGDDGVRLLFGNIQKMIEVGGLVVLEWQPWSSYRKKKNLYESYGHHYRYILHKPERFRNYLEKLGFQVIEEINPNPQNSLKHQILVFQKK